MPVLLSLLGVSLVDRQLDDLYTDYESLTPPGVGVGASSFSALDRRRCDCAEAGAPRVYSHGKDAGPGETFFLIGEGFDEQTKVIAIGRRSGAARSGEYEFQTRLQSDGLLAATVPAFAYDGPFLVRVCNEKGVSEPFVLNAPEIWWLCPDRVRVGQPIRVFGRNLGRRPDYGCTDVFLWSGKPDEKAIRLQATADSKYVAEVMIPEGLQPGKYQLWVHSGDGSTFGWSAPATLFVASRLEVREVTHCLPSGSRELESLVASYRDRDAGTQVTIRLSEGDYLLSGPLEIPSGVKVVGAGKDVTRLRLAAPAEGDAHSCNELHPHGCVVWLSGDGSAISDLSIYGNDSVNLGVAVGYPGSGRWVSGCAVERVRISDVDGKQAGRDGLMYVGSELPENSGVRLFNAAYACVADNDVCGRVPIYLSGIRQTQILRNRLRASTRWGGNGEGAIEGRNDVIEESVIEGNVLVSPPGREAGGPQTRRLIWLATGRGSVSNNWIACNGSAESRYGGVAGADQNVGEALLLESQQRVAFYGCPEDADVDSITLPSTVTPTDDAQLGHVRRTDLPYDSELREMPFLPSHECDGREAPIDQYYVTVVSGKGMGQTVRVVSRDGYKLSLATPWRVIPDQTSRIVVSTLFYRNLIVGNTITNGMAGIQLWIGCVDNVVAGNLLKGHRRQGIWVLGCVSTLASSMRLSYNRGIGPANWNHIEGNIIDETLDGIRMTSRVRDPIHVNWPVLVGNTIRNNSVRSARRDGVVVDGALSCGTIVEYNLVRDASTHFRFSDAAQVSILWRNHAYCWRVPSAGEDGRIAIAVGVSSTGVLVQENEVEDEAGRRIEGR